MRGKGSPLLFWALRPGITPAYAGKRTPRAVGRASGRDHPRVCGEKVTKIRKGAWGRGSPPRMRGKVDVPPVTGGDLGITPAYAGKRSNHIWKGTTYGDHPRVCGEKQRTLAVQDEPQGSPPRMRGKALITEIRPFVVGITPAYAGKRLKRSHRIGHFSCILCLFHSVLHRASASGGSRAGPCAPPCLPAQNAVPV